MKSFVTIFIFLIFSHITDAGFSNEEEHARIKELDKICKQARTEKLKVVQNEKLRNVSL